MAAKKGVCHLCGSLSNLSFEHVPPRSAFNDQKIVVPDVRKVLEQDNLDNLGDLPGRQLQRGQGGYTLCASCNSRTGHLYGPAYADWAVQGAAYLARARGRDTALAYPFHILPARVLKQIACMFFSINSPGFQAAHPDLVRFVINPREKYVPEPLRFFVGYIRSPIARHSGVSVALNSFTGSARLMSELTFYPYAYILALDGQAPKHEMLDITWFGHHSYDDFASLTLPIPSLDAYTPFPGDFRSRERVLQESRA